MRHLLLMLLVAVAVCTAGAATAGGRIALYADADGAHCTIQDHSPGIVEVHIVYEGDQEAGGVAFYAPTPACWTGAVWVGDIIDSDWLWGLGDTHDATKGTLVNLQGCRTGPLHLGLMNFVTSGQGEKCCRYEVSSSGDWEKPGVIDCGYNFVGLDTGDAVINATGSCGCGDDNALVAVEETTWGQVKSLYR